MILPWQTRLASVLGAAVALFGAGVCAPSSFAKSSEWAPAHGAPFKAEPIEVLGPFALFRAGPTGGKTLPLSELSADDCRRFYRETASRPARADRWSDARGAATAEVASAAYQLRDGDLVRADVTGVPEPEILLVVYASHNDGPSWWAVNNLIPLLRRAERIHPHRVRAVLFGVRHNASEHKNLVRSTWLSWIVLDHAAQSSLSTLRRFAPAEGPLVVALSRDGVPLLSAQPSEFAPFAEFADQLGQLLELTDVGDARTWAARRHFHEAVRPLAFARGTAPPLLIGTPLRIEALRELGIHRLLARLVVGADGRVREATLEPESACPEELRPALAGALVQHALVLPAIENGRPVEGTCSLDVHIPPADPQREADAAWLGGAVRKDLPIASWLVLRPIRVPESLFSQTDHVTGDDIVVLTPFNVDTARVSRDAQMNAFNSDFFGTDGAGQVRPAEGATQEVDGNRLTWKRITPVNGLVDLNRGLGNQDYCIGYAWAEFEAPEEMDAWLGLGSDDGLRVWHNGTLVADKWIRRVSRIDDDVIPLRLRAGPNQLLIKIQNAAGDWSFTGRLRGRSGR